MKSLRNHLAFIIPLCAMLLTFTIYMFTSNIIKDYKKSISSDYSIVIISYTPILKDNFNTIAGIDVKKITSLRKDKIISKLKNDLSSESVMLLKNKLPFFYKIHLIDFPTTSELTKIKDELKKNKNIKNVEIFSKNHNNVFLLLLIINNIVIVLFTTILLFTIIIISKQVKIWFYENSTQITILQLHGASILYSASKIIKQALIGAFFSFFIISSLVFFMSYNMSLFIPFELQEIITTKLDVQEQLINLFLLAFGISFLTVLAVLITYKISDD